MKLDRLQSFDASLFLESYWQRQPCLISGWLKPEPLSLGSLMALADQHELPSRLISGRQDTANWRLSHGPLTPSDLPSTDQDWTVLVQETDKVSPPVAALLEQFRFLPDWMLDDIMISQATNGGSVGAHVDAYDVFLVQAAGRRLWQLAANYDERLDDRFEMALLSHWTPETEVLAEPGDVLYLPAGIAHHGVAQGACQTWSVGLRTPSGPEMLFFLAESLAEGDAAKRRLAIRRPNPQQPAMIDRDALAEMRRLMGECLDLDDHSLAEVSARMLTSWRLWHGGQTLEDSEQAQRHLAAGHGLKLTDTARLALTESSQGSRLFVNGEAIDCPSNLAEELARSRELSPSWQDHMPSIELLIELAAIAALPRPYIVSSR